MKKQFIIPMAFIAATSVSIGTGLVINEATITNDNHTESVITSHAKEVAGTKVEVTATAKDSISIKTTWTEGNPVGVNTIEYKVELEGVIVGEKINTPTSLTPDVENTDSVILSSTTLTNGGSLVPNTEYEITVSLKNVAGAIIGTEITTATTATTAPTIGTIIPTYHSLGKVQVTVDHDDKNSLINTDESEVTISETSGGAVPIQTIELNSNPLHIYEFDNLTPETEYFVNATIKTNWDDGTTPATPATEADEQSIETPPAAYMTATTVITEKTPTTFGKQTGVATVTTTVTPDELGSEVNAPTIKIVDPSGTIPEINETMTEVGTNTNTYEYDIVGLGVNDLRNITVNITDAATGSLIQKNPLDGVIGNDILTMPVIKTIEVNAPIEQEDGTSKYKDGDLKITIENNKDAVQINKSNINVDNAMFGVIDSVDLLTTTTTNATFKEEVTATAEIGSTVSLTLNQDLFISQADMEAGYTLGMTGITSTSTDIDFNYMFDFDLTPAPESDSLSGGAIAGIVIGSIAGVALLGAGGYWLHTNKFAS